MTLVHVLIPVLARPERVEPLLESLASSRREADLVPVFLCSPNDEEEIAAARASEATIVVVPWECGPADFQRKTNLGARLAREAGADWVFLGADDLCFCPGWADEAIRQGERHSKAWVGTNDDANPMVKSGRHATHSLVRIDYLDRGTIDQRDQLYCELYDHQCCDTEAVATAMFRDEWVFARNAVVEHLHPLFKRDVQTDAVYAKGQAKGREDIALFQSRQHLWQAGRIRGTAR